MAKKSKKAKRSAPAKKDEEDDAEKETGAKAHRRFFHWHRSLLC
jgi:hypothetical protein